MTATAVAGPRSTSPSLSAPRALIQQAEDARRVAISGHHRRSARCRVVDIAHTRTRPRQRTCTSSSPSPCSAFIIPMANSALLVEDNAIARVVVRKLMAEQGMALEEAENGKAAVESVRGGKSYDLILMDREMPVMDGHEATKQLRLLGVKAPIVALSADTQQCDKDLFLQAGADEFIEKPLTKDKLAQILCKYGLLR